MEKYIRKVTWNSTILKNKSTDSNSNFLVMFSSSKASKAIEKREGIVHWCWPQFVMTLKMYSSNTNLRQLDSIHNSGLRLALGAFCTSPVSSLYAEANEAPLEQRRLKLSMHYYVKTRACIENPAHHALHEFDRTTRYLYAPRPNGRGGMTRPPAPPIGLKIEEAMTSAEINAELVCPLKTPNFPPGTHDYDPKRHDLIEGVSKCMISGQEAQAKFDELREAQGSHDEVSLMAPKWTREGGSGGHQPPFPEWWDNLPPTVQNCQTTAPSLQLRLQTSVWHWTITNTWAQSIMMW